LYVEGFYEKALNKFDSWFKKASPEDIMKKIEEANEPDLIERLENVLEKYVKTEKQKKNKH